MAPESDEPVTSTQLPPFDGPFLGLTTATTGRAAALAAPMALGATTSGAGRAGPAALWEWAGVREAKFEAATLLVVALDADTDGRGPPWNRLAAPTAAKATRAAAIPAPAMRAVHYPIILRPAILAPPMTLLRRPSSPSLAS